MIWLNVLSRIGIALTFCLGFLTGAIAGVIRHDVSDSEYLSLASESAYDAVGSVRWSEGGLSFIGSGTYLGDGWVLTAGHVADGTDFLGGGLSNWRFTVDGSTHYGDEFYVHPEWTSSQGDLALGVDLALVRLSSDPLSIDPALLYEFEDEEDQVATLVGFGSTGVGTDGYLENSAGTKRAGQNVVDATGGDFRVRQYADSLIFTDFDSPDGDANRWGDNQPLSLEYMTAPGDSGGGLFLEEDGQQYLAGVTSFGLSFDGEVDADYGDIGGYVRVSAYLDWIDEVTGILSSHDAISLEGDFNGDGIVDVADYTIWRDSLGSAETVGGGADGNGDGIVDEDDYNLWVANFGNTIPGSALAVSVPEPSAWILILICMVVSSMQNRNFFVSDKNRLNRKLHFLS